MKKALIALALLAVSAIVVTNCSKNSPVAPNIQPEQGQLMFALDAADNIASGIVTITKGSLTHVLPITIANHTGSVSFEGIQVGTWSITVQLFDADGVEIYSGSGEAVVTKNQTTIVTIQVEHNTGDLVIIVEVPGFATPTPTPGSTELIINGDFLLCDNPPYPNDWIEFKDDAGYHPEYLSAYGGKTGVMLYDCGNHEARGVRQIYAEHQAVTSEHVFEITFYIAYASLAGDGWYHVEAPIYFLLTFYNDEGARKQFWMRYNYTHDEDSADNTRFELVPQNQWVTKQYSMADMNVPLEYKLESVRVSSHGWTRVSYVDRVSFK